MESVEQELFPHPSFREKQYETLKALLDALDNGYKNIVLDAPVGTGKSALNTALLRYGDNGFYTTPQKSLRQQIQNDEALEPYVEDLKARRDYHCSVTNNNCKECSVYRSQEDSCANQGSPPCNYWRRKQTVMNSDIAVVTFSMMIVDGMLPVEVDDMQISFDDRDIIVVDEAHGLVEQTREMHAGFDVTPHGVPDGVFGNVTKSVDWEANRIGDIEDELETLKNRCKQYTENIPVMAMNEKQKRCHRLKQSINQAFTDIENDKPWVVDVDGKHYGNDYYKTLELRPIYVGTFLKNFVWDRADRRVISTATLRHRDNPDIWLKQVGLDPDNTKVISVSMTFPPEKRPVIKNHMVDSLSNGGCKENWDELMETLNAIVEKHVNEKGICHTVSYDRAKEIEETTNEDEYPYLHKNVYTHGRNEDAETAIEQWQNSDLDLMLSPSMMEGVDLADEMGRYNILMKVPYPAMSSTIDYLLNETSYGWNTYYDMAANRIAQAYGRTNRSKDDYSNFYILDEDYKKVKKRASLPKWITEAEGYPEVGIRSVFDY